jgi:ATP-dependent helicase HrpA
VVRLLRRALREPIKQARRQMPIARNLALKYTAIATLDALREDIVDAAFGQLIEAMPLDIRRREDFHHAISELSRNLFGEAMRWLVIVEDVLVAYAQLTPWLEAPLMGYARANYEDLREQLDALVHPGFVREISREMLAQFPRYLKAMRLRAERLRQDATRDQARMLTVRGYWRDYLKLKAEYGDDDAGLSELRWLIEEMRVSLFAQELKTAETVSPKRLSKLIETLRASR